MVSEMQHQTDCEAVMEYITLRRFHASAAKWMRTALFLVITQLVVVNCCRIFGTTYRSRLEESRILTLEDGTDRFSRVVGNVLPLLAVL